MNMYIRDILTRTKIGSLFSQYGVAIASATGLSAEQQKLFRESINYFDSCGSSSDSSSAGATYGIAVTVGGTSDQGSGEAIVLKVGKALMGSN